MTVAFPVLDGNGDEVQLAAEETGGFTTTHSVPEIGGAVVSETNALPVRPGRATAIGGNAFVVETGGTAVHAFSAGQIQTGGYITNPKLATQQIFVDPVNSAGTVEPGTNGTTCALDPGQTWNVPGPLTGPVSVNAPDDGHAFVAVCY